MYLKLVTAFIFSIFVFTFSITTIQANEIDSIKTLTKEEAEELAIKNHGNLKLLEAKLKSLDSQKSYVSSEINELENMDSPTISNLPTDLESFIDQYPDYEQLADEEKEAVGQLIVTQILINTSLNQLIDGQEAGRNHELQEKIKLQREELNKAAKVIDSDKNKNQIEVEQTKEAIKYYISQKYISLLLLETEVEQLKTELTYFQSDIQDFLIMKEHGLINNKDFEKKNNEIQNLEQQLSKKERNYHFYMEELKLEIGLPYNQVIYLKAIDKEQNKLPIMELESKIDSMFSVRKLEEDILLAEKNYSSTESSKSDLKDHYYHIWQATKQEKDNLEKEIKVKIKKFHFEQEEMFVNMDDLQKTKESLIVDKKDLEIQFKAGVITDVEIEKINRDIQRIESDINIYKYEFYLLNEKFTQAWKGYFL